MSALSVALLVSAGDAEVLARLAEARGAGDARRFALRDADDLDAAVRAGEIRTVFVHDPGTLFACAWRGDVDLQAWRALGVEVCFATAPANAADWLATVGEAWAGHRQRTRRARVVAGTVLSVLAMAAAFVALVV